MKGFVNDNEDFVEDGSDTFAEDVPEQLPKPKRKYLKRKQNTNMITMAPSSDGTDEQPFKEKKRTPTGNKVNAPLSRQYNV